MQRGTLGFCDLNIPAKQINLRNTVLRALKLGYCTIAINVDVSDVKCKKQQGFKFPEPISISFSEKELKVHGISRTPNILSRITITYSDAGSPFLHKVKDFIGKFDIVAFTPLSEGAFKQLCQSSMDIDILALNVEDGENAEFHLSRKLIQLCVKRDIYLELPYSPCIYSLTVRRRIIQLAHMFRNVSRSYNIIITSKAQNAEQLRNPYDVANLGMLFQMTPAAAKAALLSVSWGAVHCAQARKEGVGRCAAQVDLIKEPPSKKTKYDTLKKIDKYL